MPDRDPRSWMPAFAVGGLLFVGAAALIWAVLWFFDGVNIETSERQAAPAVVVAQPPRIVALSPALAIALRDLDLQDRIVGRHAYDMILDKSVPVCGDQLSVDYEALIAAAPTHVLMQRRDQEVPQRLKDLAASRGWKLVNAPTLTLGEIRQTVRQLAAEFSAVDLDSLRPKADATPTDPRVLRAFLRIKDRMDHAWASPVPSTQPAGPRILLLESLDPRAAHGPGSFHHELLLAVGGRPVITTGKPYITLDAEDVLRLAPEAIVIFAPRPYGSPPRATPPTPAELGALLGRLGTLDLPAIREHRIAIIDDPCCLLPSTAMIDTADELRRVIAAWQLPPHP